MAGAVGPWRPPARARQAVFAALTTGVLRAGEMRFTAAEADRHRPHGPGLPLPPASLSAGALASLERRGEGHPVAVAFALAGETDEARRRLDRLPSGPEVDNDKAALLLGAPGS